MLIELLWPLFLFIILVWVRTRGLRDPKSQCNCYSLFTLILKKRQSFESNIKMYYKKYMHENFYLNLFFQKKMYNLVLLLKLHLIDMMDFEKKEFHAYIYLDIFLIFDPKLYLFNLKLFYFDYFFSQQRSLY